MAKKNKGMTKIEIQKKSLEIKQKESTAKVRRGGTGGQYEITCGNHRGWGTAQSKTQVMRTLNMQLNRKQNL